MDCLFKNGAETNFQRKFWKFHHLQLDRKEPDKAPENILSDALMFWQADHLDNFQSSFSIWYSRKAHSFYYKPLVHRGPQWVRAVGREEKKGGRTDMSLGHQHFSGAQPSHAPCPLSSPNPPPQSPRTEKSLQAYIAFKNYLSDKVTAWPCPSFKSESWQDIQNIPCGPQASFPPSPPVTRVPAMPLLWAAR